MIKVVRKCNDDQVRIDNCSSQKIYAVKIIDTIYKLQGVDNHWMFCSMNSTVYRSSGSHDSMERAIEAQMEWDEAPIYQFDNQKEFINWCYKEI